MTKHGAEVLGLHSGEPARLLLSAAAPIKNRPTQIDLIPPIATILLAGIACTSSEPTSDIDTCRVNGDPQSAFPYNAYLPSTLDGLGEDRSVQVPGSAHGLGLQP